MSEMSSGSSAAEVVSSGGAEVDSGGCEVATGYATEGCTYSSEANQETGECVSNASATEQGWFHSEAGDTSEASDVSQEFAEEKHFETKEHNIENYGAYMSELQRETLADASTKERVNVLSAEEYINQFPEVDFSVIGHCDEAGNIYMKDISKEYVNHTVTHETMHLSADREVVRNTDGSRVVVSGLRESVVEDGRVVTDLNRGINEGVTEMYTLRELNSRGDYSAAKEVDAYSSARGWAQRMERLVGEEPVAKAYFGKDKVALKNEIIRLNGGKSDSWESFSRDVDIVEYGTNYDEQKQANDRLNNMYATMFVNKFKDYRGV